MSEKNEKYYKFYTNCKKCKIKFGEDNWTFTMTPMSYSCKSINNITNLHSFHSTSIQRICYLDNEIIDCPILDKYMENLS